MKLSTRKFWLGAAVAGSLLLTACGHDSSGGGSGSSDGPVKVFFIGDFTGPAGTAPFPEEEAGAKAAAKAINAAGGAAGHNIELTVCDTTLVQTKALQCARDALNSGAAATVVYSQLASSFYPVLTASDIPLVNIPALTPEEQRGDNVFPLTAGFVGNRAQGVAVATLVHAKAASGAYADVPAAAAYPDALNEGSTANGGPEIKTVAVPINAPDMDIYANKLLANHPDVITFATIPGDTDRLMTAIYKLDPNVKFIRPSNVTPLSSLKAVGAAADNMYVIGNLQSLSDVSIAGVKKFNDDMKAQDSSWDPSKATPFTAGPWLGIQLVAQAIEKGKGTSPKDVAASLEAHSFDFGITAGPLQFKTPNKGCGEPRCFNVGQVVLVAKDGQLVAADGGGVLDPTISSK